MVPGLKFQPVLHLLCQTVWGSHASGLGIHVSLPVKVMMAEGNEGNYLSASATVRITY
jgi:hypothetical protein